MKIGDLLFVHGGISPEFIARGLDMESANSAFLLASSKGFLAVHLALGGHDAFLLGAFGPLWYRGMLLNNQNSSITESDLEKILAHFKAKRIVVGHTTMDNAMPFYGGKVIAVDAGIQHGKREGAYFEGGKVFRALTDGSKIEMK
jgi:hypothetical protein